MAREIWVVERVSVKATWSVFMIGIGYIPGEYFTVQMPCFALIFDLRNTEQKGEQYIPTGEEQ